MVGCVEKPGGGRGEDDARGEGARRPRAPRVVVEEVVGRMGGNGEITNVLLFVGER